LVVIIQATNNQQTHTMSSTINTSLVHYKTLLTRKRAVLKLLAPLPPAGTDLDEHFAKTAPLYAEYDALKKELDAIDDIICAENPELERHFTPYY